MIWLILAGVIILLVLYIWKKLIRHIINMIVIWALQIITWCLQGAGWLTGILLFGFQVIDGKQDIKNIKFGSTQNPQSPSTTTPKAQDIEDIDLNDPEQLNKFVQENRKDIRVIPQAMN